MFKKVLSLIVCVAVSASAIFLSGCADDTKQESFTSDVSVELPHFNGIVSVSTDGTIVGDGTYDTDLFYYGENTIFGADESIIYVSIEEARNTAEHIADKRSKEGKERTAFIDDYVNEHGNYFFMYNSVTCDNTKGYFSVHNDGSNAKVTCFRSRDLSDWRLFGALDRGWSLYLERETWVGDTLWAPEVIHNPEDGKYYMYFSALRRPNNGTVLGAVYENLPDWAGFSMGIACSDTPEGPFYMVTSDRNYKGGKNPNNQIVTHINPSIDFKKELGLDFAFPVIDLHPVFIDDGDPDTFDLYVYFVRHGSVSVGIRGNTVWGMKMKDMATPDYSTIRKLCGAGYIKTVTYKGSGNVCLNSSYIEEEFTGAEHINQNDAGGVFEAPTLLTHTVNGKTKYYLLGSIIGVGHNDYDVLITVSDNPLGPFTRLTTEQGGRMLSCDRNNNFMGSLGHSCVVEAGEQTFIGYGTSKYYGGPVDDGRFYAFDSLAWYYEDAVGYELPYVNGPTRSLQPVPAVASGYTNVAGRATVSAENIDDTTLKYLTDDIISTQKRHSAREAKAIADSASITFSFETPTDLRGILIYNSYDYESAFKKIDSIEFELAEPVIIGGISTRLVTITDLPFDGGYVYNNMIKDIVRPGSASVASFEEIKVNKVTASISEHLADGSNEKLKISEIILLGK